MRAAHTVASPRIAVFGQVAIVLLAGLGLAIVAADGPLLLLLGAVVSALFLLLFLQRPALGLLIVLAARASSDALQRLITSATLIDPSGPGAGLRGLILNPNTALILILIVAGVLTIFARRLPILSLPGGTLLVLLVITGAVGTIRARNVLYSFQEWVAILAAPVTYALAAGLFSHPGAMFRIPKVLAVSFVVPAVAGYAQLLTGGGRFITGFVRIYGTFIHPNPFGLYLVILTAVFVPLMFFRSRLGALSRVIVAAAGPLLVGTYARFAWAGAAIVLGAIGIIRHRVLLLIIPLIGLVALVPTVQMRLADPLGGSYADRVRIWREIAEEALAEAGRDGTVASSIVTVLGGLGPGTAALLTTRGAVTLPHNDYVRLLVDHGVVGLLLYLSIAVIMIRLGYQAYRAARDRPSGAIALSFLALAIAYPFMSFTSNLVAATHNQLYFWALAGLCVALKKDVQAPTVDSRRPG